MPLPAAIAAGLKAAAIESVAQGSGGLFRWIGQKRAERRAELRNIKFWEKQNEYNSPVAQMQRLADAGLNPRLIYGDSASGASGQAGSIDSVRSENTITGGYSAIEKLMQFQNLKLGIQQENNLKAQEENVIQDTALKLMNTLIGSADYKTKKQYAEWADMMARYQAHKMMYDAMGSEISSRTQETQRHILDNTQNALIEKAVVDLGISKSSKTYKDLQIAIMEMDKRFYKLKMGFGLGSQALNAIPFTGILGRLNINKKFSPYQH